MIKIQADKNAPQIMSDPKLFVETSLNDLSFLCTVVLRHGKRVEFKDFNWVHARLCDFLNMDKNPVLQKLILMSRDSLKSTIARAFAIQWFLKKAVLKQDGKIFIYGGKIELPQDHLARIVNEILGNELIQTYFHSHIPSKRGDFNVLAIDKGRVRYKGIEIDVGAPESPLTGHHYEGGINDNLVNEINSRTPEMRRKIIDLWKAQESILIEKAWEFIFETTWEKDDVSGYVLNTKGKFNYKKLYRKPAYTFITDMGYAVFSCPARGRNGKPVFPAKTDETYLQRKRRKQGLYLFNRLYELQPLSEDEVIFKDSWYRNYKELPRDFIRNLSIDAAGTSGKDSSSSAITLADTDPHGIQYVSYAEKRKVSILELMNWARILVELSRIEKRPVSYIVIEREKFGIALAEIIEDKFPDMYTWQINIRGRPRNLRMERLAAGLENGKILFKHGLQKMREEIREYRRNKDKNVDLLDSLFYQTEAKIIPQETKEILPEEEDDDFTKQVKKDRGMYGKRKEYVRGVF